MDAPGHRNIRVIRQFELDKHQLHRMAGSNASSVRATPRDPTLQRDIRDIDPTYWPIKGQVEAGQALEAQVEDLKCACCKGKVDPHLEMVTICPEQHCQAPSHMACLSQRFLESEPSQEVLPIQGQCPKCESALKWVDLVKELTLRMRGEKEIKRLMKPSKKRAASGADPQEILLEDDDDDLSPEEFDEDLSPEDVIDEPHKQEVDDLMRDTEWETFSASSWASEPNSTVRIGENNGLYRGIEAELSPVIEDSDDWASAEVLE
ncbi:Slx4p interacting protein [Thelotrema lepadinum]|nr:Slx4p interacting protein [Thelotrema lepadinum]